MTQVIQGIKLFSTCISGTCVTDIGAQSIECIAFRISRQESLSLSLWPYPTHKLTRYRSDPRSLSKQKQTKGRSGKRFFQSPLEFHHHQYFFNRIFGCRLSKSEDRNCILAARTKRRNPCNDIIPPRLLREWAPSFRLAFVVYKFIHFPVHSFFHRHILEGEEPKRQVGSGCEGGFANPLSPAQRVKKNTHTFRQSRELELIRTDKSKTPFTLRK